MQLDRTVPLNLVAAVALWVLTFILILAGTVAGLTFHGTTAVALAMALMTHGLACSAGAATITIRNGLKHQNRLLEDAFNLGREAATPLRRRQ